MLCRLTIDVIIVCKTFLYLVVLQCYYIAFVLLTFFAASL